MNLAWSDWANCHDWNIFGTITFADGSRISHENATRKWSRFLNEVDITLFGQGKKIQKRMNRYVFAHMGANGDNIHCHFLAQIDGDLKSTCIMLNDIWSKDAQKAQPWKQYNASPIHNEFLPIRTKEAATKYVHHEDKDGQMIGFREVLTNLNDYTAEPRNEAIIKYLNRLDDKRMTELDASFEQSLIKAEKRYNRNKHTAVL